MVLKPGAEAQRVQKRLYGKVRQFVLQQDLAPNGMLIVAVSGGQDSSALLHIMVAMGRSHGFSVTAGYFDHRLRGPEAAAAELAAVRTLCDSLEVPLIAGGGDVRGEAWRSKQGIEATARQMRYRFLSEAARRACAECVATGHTASDQAETVLLNIVRGAGLRGLGGMAPSSGWPFAGGDDLRLVRPLLCLTRAETLEYCHAVGITPFEDESNASPDYRRNRLRAEVLPLLRELNPQIENALVRLAESARTDSALLEGIALGLVRLESGNALMVRSILEALNPAARGAVIGAAIEAVLGDRRELTSRHLDALERLTTTGVTGDSLDLPRGLRARLRQDDLEIGPAKPSLRLPETPVVIAVPGNAAFGHLQVNVTAGEAPAAAASVQVDAAAVGDWLRVRRRAPGDRFRPLGMQAEKKLQDFFVDEHVSRADRDAVPIFESARGIIWVGGHRIADWARPQVGQPIVKLSYSQMSPASPD